MINYLASFTNTDGSAFPNTAAVNATGPAATDGTEFVKIFVDDIWGRFQALLDYAGLTPNAISESPSSSQHIEAIQKGFAVGPGIGVTYWKDGDPAVLGDRVLLLTGQVILISNYPELVNATYVGDGANGSAPAFYKTSDAGGTIRSTVGTYFVLPDTRGLFLRGLDTAAVNDPDGASRLIGSIQADATAKNGLTATSSTIDSAGAHIHNTTDPNHTHSIGTTAITAGAGSLRVASAVDDASPRVVTNSNPTGITINSDGAHTHPAPTITIGAGDAETRPVNVMTKFGITY